MAVFTALSPLDAQRVATSYALGSATGVEPIPAGSVNSNFFLKTTTGTYFVRIYEEQTLEGVRYEWRLLDHLFASGLPVARRIPGPEPGEVSVDGKPVGVFEAMGGHEICQRMVTHTKAAAVGEFLARAHAASLRFSERRNGRYGLESIRDRLRGLDTSQNPELREPAGRLERTLESILADWPAAPVEGVIHGDLFRDNVRWEGDRIVAALDWESASDGPFAYDLMVTLLAWCYDDRMRWDLARSMASAYDTVRPLSLQERGTLQLYGRAAAVRFSTTRITDFYLREGIGERVYKDYTRFLARLTEIEGCSAEELVTKLLGS